MHRIPSMILVLSLLIASSPLPIGAEWDWYAGGFSSFSARNTSSSIPDRIQAAVDGGLDWIVLSSPSTEGYFPGLHVLLQEHDLNFPRLTPILATRWAPSGASQDSLVILGVDPRSPVPKGNVSRVSGWVDTQGGIGISGNPAVRSAPTRSNTGLIFAGRQDTSWHRACEIGAEWDHLLTAGHRVLLTGGIYREDRLQKVYVWSEDNRTQSIIRALRKGASYVADGANIHMDFRVNGKSMGQSVSLEKDVYIRMEAVSNIGISRVLLVSDGEIIWEVSPNTPVWEERFFLPISNRRYIRPVVECESGKYRAIGNPVFFRANPELQTGIVPLQDSNRLLPEPIYPEVDGALEVVANLTPGAQRRVLAELLRDETVRHNAVRVLEIREDLVADHMLRELTSDPDPEARLGSAYALVVRNPPELPDLLLGLLQDDDERIREYAARMLSQFAGGIRMRQLASEIWTTDPAVKTYLIRALNPELLDASLTGKLINLCRSSHPGVAAASVDKLVDMGTRSYRIIKAMLDSARQGNASALEPVELIGDRRSVNALEKIYKNHKSGELKRRSFLVLSAMGAPYLDRRSGICRFAEHPIRIDGIIDSLEWADADLLGGFIQDQDASPPADQISASFLRDDHHLFMLVKLVDGTDSKRVVHLRDPSDQTFGEDDHIEWSFHKSGWKNALRVLSVNMAGMTRNRTGTNSNWNPQWRAAVSQTLNGWIIECSIPLEDLEIIGLDPKPLRINLSLVENQSKARTTWSVTYGSPKNPDRFGDLSFGAATRPSTGSNE
jgi:hypothetical protein